MAISHENCVCASCNTEMTLRAMIYSHCAWQRGTETYRSQGNRSWSSVSYSLWDIGFLRGTVREVTTLMDFCFPYWGGMVPFAKFTEINPITLNSKQIKHWGNVEGGKTRGKKTRWKCPKKRQWETLLASRVGKWGKEFHPYPESKKSTVVGSYWLEMLSRRKKSKMAPKLVWETGR